MVSMMRDQVAEGFQLAASGPRVQTLTNRKR